MHFKSASSTDYIYSLIIDLFLALYSKFIKIYHPQFCDTICVFSDVWFKLTSQGLNVIQCKQSN